MLVLLLACTQAAPAARIVAIGDLHGDPAALDRVLAMAGLTDTNGAWIASNTTVVFTGDMMDRGPDSRGVLRRIRELQTQGHAVPLLGNHEVMNMQGDLRYVAPEDTAGYGGDAARKAALASDGEDGRWLRGLDAVALAGDTVFVHGGIDANWAQRGVPELNRLIHAAIDAPVKAPVLGSDGPLWNRAYLLADPAQACPELDKALTALGARRMVVGHTRQENGTIASRCDGRLYGIDTGLSVAYGGPHDAALLIDGGAVQTLYPPAAH